jgi:hypothetical protein
MIVSDRFAELVHHPVSAIWAGNCNQERVPDMVRLLGVQVEPDKEHILFFIPLRYGQPVIDNFAVTPALTFLMAFPDTNASYQLKGLYCSHRPSTSAEIDFQEACIRRFCDNMKREGIPGEKAYRTYFQQPAVTVRMYIQEVYEQTPKSGTGQKLSSV